MTKILVLVILSLCFGLAFAEENADKSSPSEKSSPGKKKLNLKMQPSKKDMDPGSATRLIYMDPKKLQAEEQEEQGKSKLGISVTCTDQLGMIHKKGDKGYDGCIRTLDKTSSSLQGSDKQKPSAGFTIGK